MKLSPKKFANILYILHRYCVRLIRNPWRKEFYVLKVSVHMKNCYICTCSSINTQVYIPSLVILNCSRPIPCDMFYFIVHRRCQCCLQSQLMKLAFPNTACLYISLIVHKAGSVWLSCILLTWQNINCNNICFSGCGGILLLFCRSHKCFSLMVAYNSNSLCE